MDYRTHSSGDGPPTFADVVEALDLGMAYQMLVPPDGNGRRFTYVSPNCLAMTGVPAERALEDASLLYDLVVPEQREALARAEADALAGKGRFTLEVQVRLLDGQLRWRRISAARRTLADGSTLWDGLITDITEARRTAAEVEEHRTRLEAAVEATGLGFWEWDLRTNALNWSERNRALFGLGPDTPVGIDIYLAAIHPEDLERCREVYRAARDRPDGGDFAMEHRAVMPNGQVRWIVSRGRVVVDDDGPALMVGTALDNTDRHEAEERRSLVMGELAHRAKNGLQVMMSIVAETARSADSVDGFQEVLNARLAAMARSQDLVTASGGRPVQLDELASQALTPFGLARFEIEPAISGLLVHADVAAGLALLLHEMATNAVKYGALSSPDGRIMLTPADAGPGMAALHWQELGGPRVEPSGRRGFGSRLLLAALRQNGGKVEHAFNPEGFSARMEFQITS